MVQTFVRPTECKGRRGSCRLPPLPASLSPSAKLLQQAELTHVEANSWFALCPAWLAQDQILLDHLREQLGWEQRAIHLFGRAYPQPRLISWAGSLPYRYSGQTLPPCPFPPPLVPLLRAVRELADVPFNHVLLNYYRDGHDGMGWHADDEPELGSAPLIASLSLGTPRDFRIKPKRELKLENPACYQFRLGHGALLIMGGHLQSHYVHALPKRKREPRPRLNLTFRFLRSAPKRA